MAAGETPEPDPVGPPAQPTGVRAARAASIEAAPPPVAARRDAEPEPKCAWRPRVVAEAPLPAFGPGSHAGSPSVPPPPD